MATVADQATDLLQDLSLDSQTKALEIDDPIKKPSVDSGDAKNSKIQSGERPMTPFLQDFVDPSTGYHPNFYPSSAYYYGSYDGMRAKWEDYSRYVNPEGVEMPPGVFGDNGSLMYHHGYGFAPYGPYSPAGSPVPNMGHDGQLYGAQHYQYPYLQPLTPNSAPYNPTSAAPPRGESPTPEAADQTPLPVDAIDGKCGLPGGIPTPGYQDPRFAFDGLQSAIPWLDGPIFSNGQPRPTSTSMVSHANNTPASKNQNFHSHSQFTHIVITSFDILDDRSILYCLIDKCYTQINYTASMEAPLDLVLVFESNGYDSRTNGRGWLAVDNKYKPRGRSNGFFGYSNENIDGLNELNRGPRAKSSKNQKGFTPTPLAVKGQNIPLDGTNDDEKEKLSVDPDREQYNKVDFPENYSDAKFFVIKSYSEDDVHKSIKYNVWSSTPNGNKKLDAAYQEALQRSAGCPVFLFFSVNTSGQFVGVAEMLGPVDFHKNFEYWQQDKWNGCFPVKWHIVKDVSNSLLKHIILENNDNKPVTNSRDTQVVKLEQGLQMLKIFKDNSSKTCILDDFGFYEGRQKTIQEKKVKQLQQEPNYAVQSNGDVRLSENGSVTKSGDSPKGAKSAVVPEKRVVANGVANGY
ncbi:evolutionarily conserved C-terminal region 2 [Actinidia rufa]|uniref:YTH domain-containing family protein n=1 Tax=Actinidia rufa TaxID=165716 RepID=A0A7J0FJX8_9ERIC|nr:evolutionarily conserved C-terminal region 2 [Actinidia rufa]